MRGYDPSLIIGFVDIATAIALLDVGLKLAGHLGVVQGSKNRLDKAALRIDEMAKSELKAGLDFLAASQISEHEPAILLQDARRCFAKSVHVESEPGQLVGYLGLAACYSLLNDQTNATLALAKITEVDLRKPSAGVLAQLIPISGKFDDSSTNLRALQREVCRYLCNRGFPHQMVAWLE